MSKTAFYYRTQKEFGELYVLVQQMDADARKMYNFRGTTVIVKSRYLGDPKADTMPTPFIPYSVPGKKKFIGTIIGNVHKMRRADIDPVKVLEEFGLPRVQHSDSHPKYKGKTSEQKTRLKNYKQFLTLVSMFDTEFGSGNWNIQGPKRLQNSLKEMDSEKDWGEGARLKLQYPKGIPVNIVVKKPAVEVGKYIFKLALMT